MYSDNVPRVAKRFLKEYAESEEAKAEKEKAERGNNKKPNAQRGDGSRGGDGRRRGRRGNPDRDDETDPDKLLIRDFHRAIGQHMRANGGQPWGRSRGRPGA